MRVKLRLAAVGFAFLVPALLMVRWSTGINLPVAVPALSLPTQVGPWRAMKDEQLSESIWAIIQPDAHMMRRYEAPGRTPIWIYLGLYVGRTGSGKSAHDPEICYPAQGWEIMESRSRTVALGNDETLSATLLKAHHGVRQESVLYWFQPAARWPASSAIEQLLRIYDALIGQPQYAFVRFSGPSDGSPTADGDLEEFAAEIAPAIRLAVEQSRLAKAGPG